MLFFELYKIRVNKVTFVGFRGASLDLPCFEQRTEMTFDRRLANITVQVVRG